MMSKESIQILASNGPFCTNVPARVSARLAVSASNGLDEAQALLGHAAASDWSEREWQEGEQPGVQERNVVLMKIHLVTPGQIIGGRWTMAGRRP